MSRTQLVSALIRTAAMACVAASGWTVDVFAGLLTSAAALLGLVYLPDGDAA